MKAATAPLDLDASCACGKCRIAVRGPVGSMFLCACRDCQAASGSGHAAVAIADVGNVEIEGDLHEFARPAASGARLTRFFCAACGITLFARSSRRLDAILLPVGIFSDQDWFKPNQTIFARDHQAWDTLPNVPAHQTYRETK